MNRPLSLEALVSRGKASSICLWCRHERYFHASPVASVRERPHRRIQVARPATSRTVEDDRLFTSDKAQFQTQKPPKRRTEDDLPEPITSVRSIPSKSPDRRNTPPRSQPQPPQYSIQSRDPKLKQSSAKILSKAVQTPTSPPPQSTSSPTAFSALNAISPTIPAHNAFTNYILAPPPTNAQLSYANRFFTSSQPTFLFGSAKFRTLPPSSLPEVAFLGRSNVGKSSLLNALLHRTGVKVAHVSGKPGRTRQMNAFGVGGDPSAGGGVRVVKKRLEAKEGEGTGKEVERWIGRGGLVVLDMPGYGKASREAWGREIVKYLVGRKQLRRTFILIDAEHGPKRTDIQLLNLLRTNSVAYTIVLSKIDKLLFPRNSTSPSTLAGHLQKLPEICRRVQQQLEQEDGKDDEAEPLTRRKQAGATAAMALTSDVLTCSAEKAWPISSGRKIGVENLRWAVLGAAGLDCDEDGHRRGMQFDVESWEQEDEEEDDRRDFARPAREAEGRRRFV